MINRGRTEFKALRMSPEEVAMVDALADADGLTASDAIRLLIRRAFKERFGKKLPKKRP